MQKQRDILVRGGGNAVGPRGETQQQDRGLVSTMTDYYLPYRLCKLILSCFIIT